MAKLKLSWGFYKMVRAFFPLQLIIAQLKHNILSLVLWLVLFLFITDSFGYAFGIPLLFLSPEYMGEVSAWSFLFLGFSIGGFVMGFNTYSYMRLGPLFPFLVTLDRPFFKFCINNSFIPTVFVLLFTFQIIQFQNSQELASVGEITLYLLSFYLGFTIFIILSFFYFFRVGSRRPEEKNEQRTKPVFSFLYKRERWFEQFHNNEGKLYLYLGNWLRLRLSRHTDHIEKELAQRIFAKNRINASIFEILTIVIFFVLGAFSDYKPFEVPAAVSIVLLLTITHMLISALHSWLGGWIYAVLFIMLFGMNYLSLKTPLFHYTSYAYGLDYGPNKTCSYSINDIRKASNQNDSTDANFNQYIQTLNNWKNNTGKEKPKLIIINTSGGGSRSAMWTMTVLQKTDESFKGELNNQIHLITGASGGMIGAAYYRELLLRQKQGEIKSIYDRKYRENIGKDMLNKLSFSASTNDIFFRYQSHTYKGKTYSSDRGYAFEEQLHFNTENLLQHTLGYYRPFEQKATIPTMIFTPTVINDGRRLLICSQHLDFLTTAPSDENHLNANENIDYYRLLEGQPTSDIRFSTVLRSNATFPFVMPMVTLPTDPEIQLMDAGIRDNYGVKTMMEFLYSMQDWISQNTSGVIVLQIRDTKKILDNEHYEKVSFIDKIGLPFGNMYKNFPRVQDFNQDELINLSSDSFEFPMEIISFNLRENIEDRISLSWHLTKQEKLKVEKAFESSDNQKSLAKLKSLL